MTDMLLQSAGLDRRDKFKGAGRWSRARIGQRNRVRDKGLHVGRCADPRERYFDRKSDQHKRTELLELARAGADVRHGAEVKSEVADIGAVGTNISLLADHDVIDQTRALCIVRREPRTLVHVISCWSRFSSDMKSQTAKT
jgi:hypothetical protein